MALTSGVALALVLCASAGVAASASSRGALSFAGTCRFDGHVNFRPGLSNHSQTIVQTVWAPGNCSGTFVDRRGVTHRVNAARVAYSARERAPGASCAAGSAAGHGALVSPYGRLAFRESETRVGVGVVATANGLQGGSAHGVAFPSTSANPTTLLSCADSGIHRAPITIVLTSTPALAG